VRIGIGYGEVIAAVVLAAGASTRLGEPKQLAMLGGETLLERVVRTAREAGCSPVVVVLGAAYVEVLAGTFGKLGDAIPVINDQWRKGMSTSVGLGVGTLALVAKGADGVVLMTCDQPAVTAEHLRALMASGEVTASAYAGRRGVPAYFPAASFAGLMELRGDAGARELLRGVATVELTGGELDVDTAADLAEAKRLFR
jgi:CTP:molybdopterin cytidylyltransferase MocA